MFSFCLLQNLFAKKPRVFYHERHNRLVWSVAVEHIALLILNHGFRLFNKFF